MDEHLKPRLYRGDCVHGMRSLASHCASLVLTDPPYGINYHSRRGETIANDERPFIWWLPHAHRVAAPDSSLICFHRWDVSEAFRIGIELSGFTIRSQVVWDKVRHGMGDTSKTFAPKHELAWHATKGRWKFPSGRPKSVMTVPGPSAKGRTHPTEKPVPLLAELIEHLTRPGDLVVDPFTGTGSTAVACLRTGRRFVGWELNPDYVTIAQRRIRSTLRELRSRRE